MHRWLSVVAIVASACSALPHLLFPEAGKEAPPKGARSAPNAQSTLPSIAPPPAPAAVPRVARPAGHLDPLLVAALGVTPQVSDLGGLYDRSAAEVGPSIDGAVLVCSVLVTGSGYDDSFFAGGADVYVTLQINRGEARRTAQSSRRMYSFPVAHLAGGDDLHVRVLDQDVLSDDFIGEGHATFSGSPMTIRTQGADVSCRVATGSAVAQAREQVLHRLARALDRMNGVEPDLTAYDFGYPSDRASDANDALRDAYAWMEPRDDELEGALDRIARVEERWEDRTREAIDAALAAPPSDPVLRRIGSLGSEELACGAGATRLREELGEALEPSEGCVLRFEITARRGGALPAAGAGALELWGIDRSGFMIPAQVIGRQRGTDWLARSAVAEPISYGPGERLTFVLAFPAGTRPALLRVGCDRDATLLRVE